MMGALWTGGRMFKDAVEVPVEWASLPHGNWAHVHLEAAYAFTDNLNIMSRTLPGDPPYVSGCLKVLRSAMA